MISGKRVYSRRVFVMHGVLLFAVLATAYLTVRAQYEALRDQQLEEARTDQQLTTRVAALTLQGKFQLLVSALTDLNADDTDVAASAGWLTSLGTVERPGGQIKSLRRGTVRALSDAVAAAPWLANVEAPALATTASRAVALAVPQRSNDDVAVGLIAPEQIAQDLALTTSRAAAAATTDLTPNTRTLVIADDGRVIASSGSDDAGTWLQQSLDPQVARKLNELLASGNAGSELIDAAGTSLLAVQPFVLTPGVRWSVVSVRSDVLHVVSLRLRPLFWQLSSQSALMLGAVMVVLISTTVSLTRGRRRIEHLRTEMLNRDLQKARRIQLNWLPAPQFEGTHVNLAAENKPALHISGDFYNWFELPAGEDDRTQKTVVVIGDVSGHGMPAAFLMATTQLLVRNTMPRVRDPGLCLAEINRQLASLVYNGQFVTMMILVIDHDNAGLQIASAGHHAPLLKRDGRVEPLAVDPQLVIGVDDSTEYQTHRFRARPGDAFLLYTDGAIEMTDATHQQFTVERLAEAFAEAGDLPREMLQTVTDKLDTFRGDQDPEDDLTLIAVQLVQCSADTASTVADPAGRSTVI